MAKCVRCCLELPDHEFEGGSKGRRYQTCSGCRNSSPATTTLRRCAGTPGRPCFRVLTDYRCPACWKRVRSVDVGAHHTEMDFAGGISTSQW